MRPKVVPIANTEVAKAIIEKGYRVNGTRRTDFRKFELKFGTKPGTCEVIFKPGTRVWTQVSCSIGEPSEARPGEGIMTVSVFISPSTTGEMGGGVVSKKAPIIARIMEKLFKENRVVDMDALCISYGEKVWILRIDVHILEMNGCLAEAAAISVLAGLMTFKIPETYIDADTKELVLKDLEDSIPISLHLNHFPILTSFVITQNSIIVEADQEEEDIFGGKLSIGLNESGELGYLHVTCAITEEMLHEATALARKISKRRVLLVKDLVQKEIEQRDTPEYSKPNKINMEGKVFDLNQLLLSQPIQDLNINSNKWPLLDQMRVLESIPSTHRTSN